MSAYDLYLLTAPTVEPVTAADVRTEARIAFTSDDALIGKYITEARIMLENFLGRSFINQSWVLYVDECEEEMVLPRDPVSAITSVKILPATTGSDTLYAATNYELRSYLWQARIKFYSIPSPLRTARGLKIEYVAGYGAAGSAVPQDIKNDIARIAAGLYARKSGDEIYAMLENSSSFYRKVV